MKKVPLFEKALLNPEEAVAFYGFSRRKFYRLIGEDKSLPFLRFYNKRKLVDRRKFEKYMAAHPGMKEGLKNGKPPIPKKA